MESRDFRNQPVFKDETLAAERLAVQDVGEEEAQIPRRHSTCSLIFSRKNLLFVLLFVVLFLRGVSCQEQKTKNKPERAKTVTDLFNTSSCGEPPFRCPYPRIEFYLYTRSSQEIPELLDLLGDAGPTLNGTFYNGEHPTKVLIHGFGGGRKLSPSPDLRKAYFTRGEYNIIVVDYSSLVVEPCLSQIEWSPRFCALCIAQLVGWLEAGWLWSAATRILEEERGEGKQRLVGAPAQNVHIIGYSIGAHIAGLVANYVGPERIGRITGLDPTIIFYMGSNRTRDLDPTDALFVDVIHTGAGVLGQWGPNGHVDFYVNGGTSQPGCGGGIYETLACDHQKVTPYFIESITTKVGFWAAPCSNLLLYLVGWCTNDETKYIKMGEDVPRSARGIYYLDTNARKPYAKGLPASSKMKRARRG